MSNEGDARRTAHWNLQQAEKSGADSKTVGQLRAIYQAADAKEEAAKNAGKNR